MLADFFTRLFQLFLRRPAPALAPVLVTPVPALPARPRAAPAAAAAAVPVGLGARRPLVAASGALAGFEFHAAPALRARDADAAVQRARTGNLLGAMRLTIGQNLVALAELPASWLARWDDNTGFAPGMQLLLGADALFADAAAVEALVQRLRAAGVRVGWRPPQRDGDPLPPGRPDFLALPAPDHPDADLAAWRATVADAQARWPGVAQVLLDLPDVDMLESLLAAPVTLAACAVGLNAAPAVERALPPQAHTLLRLLNRLVRDEDSALVVADIKSDAALSLRLLQLINSAGNRTGRTLDSIDQAVMVLGRDTLYRWVAQMLVRLAPARPAGQALQAQALARARFLELLARASGQASDAGGLYLLGLATMLPLLLQCRLDEALQSLHLPAAALQALRGDDGPWLRHLALLNALERRDMVAAEALAQSFGGLDAVLACSAQAWQTPA